MIKILYEEQQKFNSKTGMAYIYLAKKTPRLSQAINPAPFEQAMPQSQVGMAHDMVNKEIT